MNYSFLSILNFPSLRRLQLEFLVITVCCLHRMIPSFHFRNCIHIYQILTLFSFLTSSYQHLLSLLCLIYYIKWMFWLKNKRRMSNDDPELISLRHNVNNYDYYRIHNIINEFIPPWEQKGCLVPLHFFSPTYYHVPSRQIQSFHADSLGKSEMTTAMVSMWNAPHRRMWLNTPGTVWKTWETETFKKKKYLLGWLRALVMSLEGFNLQDSLFSLQPAPWMEPIYPP